MADETFDDPPSKSSRKRAAHAAQDLGSQLIGMRDAELVALALPEPLLDAIREARRLTSRGALLRQRQYIGKLMRQVDLTGIEAAVANRARTGAADAGLHKRAERWRERLLAGDDAALEELAATHEPLDRERLRALAAAARDPRSGPAARTASRALFRALRDLLARPNC